MGSISSSSANVSISVNEDINVGKKAKEAQPDENLKRRQHSTRKLSPHPKPKLHYKKAPSADNVSRAMYSQVQNRSSSQRQLDPANLL